MAQVLQPVRLPNRGDMHRLKAYATNGFTKTYMHPGAAGRLQWAGVRTRLLAGGKRNGRCQSSESRQFESMSSTMRTTSGTG